MRHRPFLRPLTAVLATVAASAGLLVGSGGTAHAATPLPAHVFAPYFEAYNGDSLSGLAAQSGAKYVTVGFVAAEARGSCTPYWDGDTNTPISASHYGSDIAAIRAGGGDVIPSFGGYGADNGGTEIADSCTSPAAIAAAYEKVITTYDAPRLDLDTEDNSLTDAAGIDRRNKAIKLVEDWAAANGRSVQFSYTLPSTTGGLDAGGLAVLRNAVANNARIDVVDIMTFDYYDGASHHMATDTETAAQGLYNQLATLYPAKTPAQLWSSIGVIEDIGVDDFGPGETFTTADAVTVYNWAVAKGINTLSFWAMQRDNGNCPGAASAGNCSGVAQSPWQFSHTFEPFTSGSTTTPPPGGGTRSGAITGYGGKCVDVASASSANGAAVQLYDCNATTAQTWTAGTDGTLKALGKCMDVTAAGTANGAKIQLYDCNGTAAQKWTPTAGTLVNTGSGRCLDATGPSSANGTRLQIWTCNSAAANQQWHLPS